MDSFIFSLQNSLGSLPVTKRIKITHQEIVTEAIFILDVFDDIPNISVFCMNIDGTYPTTAMWQLHLTSYVLQNHMEDDINLFDEKGVGGFGLYFGDAIRRLNTFQTDGGYSSTNKALEYFPLHLIYIIGGCELKGILNLPLVQADIHAGVHKIIGRLTALKQDTPHLSPQPPGSSVSNYAPENFGFEDGLTQSQSDTIPATQIKQKMTAKRKRGGAALFPGR